ncbi:MAG: carbon starvation protein A [Prevotella sp.]|nr:carbon starvation protein A [Prevotella sp.]
MISFIISLLALVAGYFVYGKFVERVFAPDGRPTPAITKADGVDFIAMPTWKVFMIQFLNIAGTGPIFGAIMGAWYGPKAYLWIVLGCIFAGAMHDFFSGMLSIRNGGANLPELIGKYLGIVPKNIMLVFSVFLLVMVGVVFVYSPALLLEGMMPSVELMVWIIIIFVYYIFATLLPIDKIIGRFYPFFAFSLLFMATALMIVLFVKWPAIPELWDELQTANVNNPANILDTDSFISNNPIFPCLFLTIACGAISGFHATQSPLMARCLKDERLGRPIFYGSMITEGLVALIWASVSTYFFYYGGWREVVPQDIVNTFNEQFQGDSPKTLIQFFTAPNVVNFVCNGWLGLLGGILAVLGVVAAPITSGDTAFRSARLIIASALKMNQRSVSKRLMISLPMFAASIALLFWQIQNPNGFNTIWQYFGWGNQSLSVFTLWAITVYLVRHGKPYIISLIPALFMTAVCSTFIFVSPTAFGNQIPTNIGFMLGGVCLLVAIVWFVIWRRKWVNNNTNNIK